MRVEKKLSILNRQFTGPNLGYAMELYEKYLENPQSVDEESRLYFHTYGSPAEIKEQSVKNKEHIQKEDQYILQSALTLAHKIRDYGHLAADIDPLNNPSPVVIQLEPSHYDLTNEDLKSTPANLFFSEMSHSFQNGLDAFQFLKNVYTGKIAFEFHHVSNISEKKWLQKKVEEGILPAALSDQRQIELYKRLVEVEEFEKFLHRTYTGQKRFSIEGLDTMVLLIDELISGFVNTGIHTINIGMAHRGRLNVLAHILGKPYEMIFAEYQHALNKKLIPYEDSIGINFGWTGDVKYHLGLERSLKNVKNVTLNLANNPSHLEFIGAVVEGFTRASQDTRTKKGYPEENPDDALSVIIHGDAAFPGQGIVAETLNLGNLTGYRTHGSIHIIANNMIGFTTEPNDSRSTRYASDLAKGFEVPIVHVNADDPESCIKAAVLACEYRKKFHKDFLIDLIGYRRYGHNEMDEPMTTNPLMYHKIRQHPTVKELFAEKLLEVGVLTEEWKRKLEKEVVEKLEKTHERVPERNDEVEIANPPANIVMGFKRIKTGVSIDYLREMNEELLSWPKTFKVFPKLEKILQRRRTALNDEGRVDWGHAEALAFASILCDGIPIRLTGQDSERGTFAQRNLVLHDVETGESFLPLHALSMANASFAIHNSPLSEGAVLGFEYGYNVYAPETLVLWEAQYGDFANAAQVIFDQFIAAGRAKWGQKSGLVILLPHGYEGQGPEHSSGRLERLLLLAAENNWTVANLTSAAQYFHILRRQAAYLTKDEIRPLVIMTPKSLLRHHLVASESKELFDSYFKLIIEEPGLGQRIEQVERIVFCTGKMGIELAEKIKGRKGLDWLHIIRIEQLYPFPEKDVSHIIKRYDNLREVFWVQEEPQNMGAWNFVQSYVSSLIPKNVTLSYIGRQRRSSPSEGDSYVHKKDQARIVSAALRKGD